MRYWTLRHIGMARSTLAILPRVAMLIVLGLAMSQASWAAAPGVNPVSATPSADPIAPAKPKPKTPPLPPLAASYAPTRADSCSETCGRKYYFCLSAPAAVQCPEQWTQCRSQCLAAPGLASPRP